MNLTDEIRKTIESVKDMKIQMGGINNYLSTLENLVRKDITEQVDDAHRQGLEDAWEYAKKIVLNPDDGGLGLSELNEIFGFYTLQSIFKNYTVQQAIEKLKAYEKEQKANDEIKVGDEVINNTTGSKGILLEPETKDMLATVIIPSQRWRTFNSRHSNLKKTGKHYNIEGLLKVMNGMKE